MPDFAEHVFVLPADEGQCYALLSRTRGSSDSVEVHVRFLRQVVVDDMCDF